MNGSRFLSVLAGVILGSIFGYFFYTMSAWFLVSGPLQEGVTYMPEEMRNELLSKGFWHGVIPGAVFGIWSGLVCPFLMPRGHFSKSIAVPLFLIETVWAWIENWSNIHYMTGGRIAITIGVVFFMFIFCLPIAEQFSFIEKLRDPY